MSLNTSTVLDAQWGFEETFLSKEGALVERAVYAACLLDCIPKGHAGVLTNQQEYLIETQAFHAAGASHSIRGGSALVPVRKG